METVSRIIDDSPLVGSLKDMNDVMHGTYTVAEDVTSEPAPIIKRSQLIHACGIKQTDYQHVVPKVHLAKKCLLAAEDVHGTAALTSLMTVREDYDGWKMCIDQDYVNEKGAAIRKLRQQAEEKHEEELGKPTGTPDEQ